MRAASHRHLNDDLRRFEAEAEAHAARFRAAAAAFEDPDPNSAPAAAPAALQLAARALRSAPQTQSPPYLPQSQFQAQAQTQRPQFPPSQSHSRSHPQSHLRTPIHPRSHPLQRPTSPQLPPAPPAATAAEEKEEDAWTTLLRLREEGLAASRRIEQHLGDLSVCPGPQSPAATPLPMPIAGHADLHPDEPRPAEQGLAGQSPSDHSPPDERPVDPGPAHRRPSAPFPASEEPRLFRRPDPHSSVSYDSSEVEPPARSQGRLWAASQNRSRHRSPAWEVPVLDNSGSFMIDDAEAEGLLAMVRSCRVEVHTALQRSPTVSTARFARSSPRIGNAPNNAFHYGGGRIDDGGRYDSVDFEDDGGVLGDVLMELRRDIRALRRDIRVFERA